ncbi:hypothetical protein DPMN_040338 [Dreissena polymorpha]|uniref:Uncharacterized protein n=1 Tax=Dreissena polymorpha TaxID=45954 RepID=A0A9D4HV41_DREPO|nr:hypothetical protein DPMN_040338 [Dreissena polymorpha]
MLGPIIEGISITEIDEPHDMLRFFEDQEQDDKVVASPEKLEYLRRQHKSTWATVKHLMTQAKLSSDNHLVDGRTDGPTDRPTDRPCCV